jgi:hypothetical protein
MATKRNTTIHPWPVVILVSERLQVTKIFVSRRRRIVKLLHRDDMLSPETVWPGRQDPFAK